MVYILKTHRVERVKAVFICAFISFICLVSVDADPLIVLLEITEG